MGCRAGRAPCAIYLARSPCRPNRHQAKLARSKKMHISRVFKYAGMPPEQEGGQMDARARKDSRAGAEARMSCGFLLTTSALLGDISFFPRPSTRKREGFRRVATPSRARAFCGAKTRSPAQLWRAQSGQTPPRGRRRGGRRWAHAAQASRRRRAAAKGRQARRPAGGGGYLAGVATTDVKGAKGRRLRAPH